MATTDVALHEASGHPGLKRTVNDMSIQVATVNGSGSQSSNTVLLRSIFQMGVPVSGRTFSPPILPASRPGTRFAPIKTDTWRARKRLIFVWR
jgi:2-oxoglutarate/2-oxoacid ferredoxin oxidoreductase subunit alpha